MTQTDTFFTIIHLTPEYMKTTSSKLNPLITKLAFVCCLNSFVLILTKLIHMVILLKKTPSIKTFRHFGCNPHLPTWFSIFIQDWVECQTNRNFHFENNTSPPLPFYENETYFNYRISMDTRGYIAPSSHGNSYLLLIIDVFGHFVVTNPVPHISTNYAIQTLLHNWNTKIGPPQYLVTDRGTEYIIQDMAPHLSFLFNINRSPRTPYSPWTTNFGTELRLFLQNPPTNWSFQTRMYAYAHNTIHLPQLKLSRYQIVFIHTLVFHKPSLSIYHVTLLKPVWQHTVIEIPPHNYSDQDLNPFFHSLLKKPLSCFYQLNMHC